MNSFNVLLLLLFVLNFDFGNNSPCLSGNLFGPFKRSSLSRSSRGNDVSGFRFAALKDLSRLLTSASSGKPYSESDSHFSSETPKEAELKIASGSKRNAIDEQQNLEQITSVEKQADDLETKKSRRAFGVLGLSGGLSGGGLSGNLNAGQSGQSSFDVSLDSGNVNAGLSASHPSLGISTNVLKNGVDKITSLVSLLTQLKSDILLPSLSAQSSLGLSAAGGGLSSSFNGENSFSASPPSFSAQVVSDPVPVASPEVFYQAPAPVIQFAPSPPQVQAPPPCPPLVEVQAPPPCPQLVRVQAPPPCPPPPQVQAPPPCPPPPPQLVRVQAPPPCPPQVQVQAPPPPPQVQATPPCPPPPPPPQVQAPLPCPPPPQVQAPPPRPQCACKSTQAPIQPPPPSPLCCPT